MKFCNRCGQEHDESLFYRRTAPSRGTGSFQAWCIPCRRAYERERTGSYPTQTCSECGTTFNERKASAFTCSSVCAYARKLRLSNEKRRLRPRTKDCRWCGASFESSRASQLYCSARCRDATARLPRYGMTVETFLGLLDAQKRRCAVCQAAMIVGGQGWSSLNVVIDHCHDRGHVRGLLCTRCNVMLGQANDDPARLRAAAAYLEAAS